jgi:very-short-patch-repair endonuclease
MPNILPKQINMTVSGIQTTKLKLQRNSLKAIGATKLALREEAERIMAISKEQYVPVDTGNLRASGHVKTPQAVGSLVYVDLGYGGAAAPYALCVGAKMRVPIKGGGVKHMNSIKVGDQVLTQAGVWKPVKNVFKYPVQDGTPLLYIHSPWRSGKDHVLEVTENHEIMVERGGKNQWIRAGDLVVGDVLYKRKKQVHNKGVSSRYVNNCKECGVEFTCYPSQKKKNTQFHSIECYWKFRARPGNNALSGRKRLPSTIEKMRVGKAESLVRNPESHPLRVLAKKGHKSSHEEDISQFLDKMGIEYERNKRVGRYFPDFWCPGLRRIIEADGSRWHRDQQKDIDRDKELLDVLGDGWDIVHIHYFEARYSPTVLIPNPLPNVHYVSVNPGTATYAEPNTFERTPITRIEREVYFLDKTKHKTLGEHNRKNVYDLEVEDIQSYTVSGLLVHNSVHENPRSGKTGGISPSGFPYEHWAQTGEWKYLETPVKQALPGLNKRIQTRVRTVLQLSQKR